MSPSHETSLSPRLRRWNESLLLGRMVVGLAIVASTAIASVAWYQVKTPQRTIRVTGSATQRIVSDLIEWNAKIRHTAPLRADAYRKVAGDVAAVVEYLNEKGIDTEDIRISSAEVQPHYTTEYEQVGSEAVPHQRLAGYGAEQNITVTSQDVQRVERVSREVTALLDRNIPIESSRPQYHYKGLESLKIEMLAAAAKDARTRAEQMLAAAGDAQPGDLAETHMGVININPANSTATSWEGNNDKSSLDKDIITVVHATYTID